MKHWQAFANQLKAKGKLSEYNVLSQAFTLEGTVILIKFANSVQQDILASIKEELVADLRAKLQHEDIDIKSVVVKEEKSKKPYTAQEKFNYLAKKYPDLLTLKQRLSLEVED